MNGVRSVPAFSSVVVGAATDAMVGTNWTRILPVEG
jgi:hypothetical protein